MKGKLKVPRPGYGEPKEIKGGTVFRSDRSRSLYVIASKVSIKPWNKFTKLMTLIFPSWPFGQITEIEVIREDREEPR